MKLIEWFKLSPIERERVAGTYIDIQRIESILFYAQNLYRVVVIGMRNNPEQTEKELQGVTLEDIESVIEIFGARYNTLMETYQYN